MRTVENGIGQPVRRKEDWRLLTGRGCYVDDLAPANLAHAVIVRSPHAHARLVSVDARAAHAAPGVYVPTTIVLGDHNEAIRCGHTKSMAPAIPNSKLMILPSVGHFAMRQDPPLYNQAILSFLDGSSPPNLSGCR